MFAFLRIAGLDPPLRWDLRTRTRTFWLMAGAYFLLGIINTALITQQIPMLIDFGLTPQAAAFVQSVFGIAMMVGRLGTGYVIDRVFAPWVMIVVSLGAAVACAMYGTGVTGGMVFVSACLIGLVVGAEFDVLALIIKHFFGIRWWCCPCLRRFHVVLLGHPFSWRVAPWAFVHVTFMPCN